MRKICATLFAVATAFVGKEALAQDWSFHGGDTVEHGDMIGGEFGWPDASFVWAHGVSRNVDVGIKLPLIYGIETTVCCTHFGTGVMVPIRINIARSHKFSGMIIFEPGLRFYPDRQTLFGPAFMFGFQGGIHVTPEAQVVFGADFNLWVDVTPGGGQVIPVFAPEFGPGFEYHVDRNLAVGINMRFGPVIFGNGGCGGLGCGGFANSNAVFGLVMQAFIGYRF